jgi:hypothetical protein
MSECEACRRPTQLFLCTDCTTELSDMLTSLISRTETETMIVQSGRTASGGRWRIERDRKRRIPGLLIDLENAANGQTRFGGGPRISSGGDEAPLRFNSHARELITQIRAALVDWADRLAKHTGITFVPLGGPAAAEYALWLAHHAATLAKIQGAGRFHRRLTKLTKKAQRCVDSPPALRFCGQCDTKIDHTGGGRKICGLALYAHRDAIEVTCPNPECGTIHNVEKLYNRTLNAADYKTFPREVLIGNQRTDSPERYCTGIMGELDEFVHWRTFDRWAAERRIKPAMYQRPGGRRGFFRHNDDDIPEYRLSDVRKVKRAMDRKTGKAKTG